MRFPQSLYLVGLTCFLFTLGCGGDEVPNVELPDDLTPVTGTVTLDGQPLEGALVVFMPAPGAKFPQPSRGVTDATGKYVLNYAIGVPGATPGEHPVAISKSDENETEMLPAIYNSATTLKAEVKAGENNIPPFDLKSKP